MPKPKGRHPHQRLNAVRVKNISKPGRHADGNGLYLLVEKSGAKRWMLRTIVAGKRCDIGLGSLQLVKLPQAREEATQLRSLARKGQDVLAARRSERRTVPTFEQAAKEVHAQHSASFRNKKHKNDWLASLEADVFPVFGSRPVNAVDAGDVLKALTPIWTKKPETARRVKQRVKVVLDWALASGHRTGNNPVDGLTKVLPRHRQTASHHPALPYGQVPEFVQTIRDSNTGEPAKLAFEFLILTAARTTEVTGATWTEIDRESKTWTIPAERIKAGREHRVPLSERCLELLAAARKSSAMAALMCSEAGPRRCRCRTWCSSCCCAA